MRAFVIFNGVVRSGTTMWHGTAQHGLWYWLVFQSFVATWPYFSPGQSSSPMTPQVISKYRRNLSLFAVHTLEMRKEGRVGEGGTIERLL